MAELRDIWNHALLTTYCFLELTFLNDGKSMLYAGTNENWIRMNKKQGAAMWYLRVYTVNHVVPVKPVIGIIANYWEHDGAKVETIFCWKKVNRLVWLFVTSYIASIYILDGARQNLHNRICSQRRRRSPCAVAESFGALCETNDPSLLHTNSEDSNQNAPMRRLIWDFAGIICHVGFVVLRHIL